MKNLCQRQKSEPKQPFFYIFSIEQMKCSNKIVCARVCVRVRVKIRVGGVTMMLNCDHFLLIDYIEWSLMRKVLNVNNNDHRPPLPCENAFLQYTIYF